MKINLQMLKKIVIVVILAALYFLYINASMNFTFLGIIAFMLVLFGIRIVDLNFKGQLFVNGNRIKPEPPVRNPMLGWWSSIFIVAFSILTLCTLNNYFYADKEVYTNNEHHAIRVEGIRINDARGFVLAKNDKTAFFDNDKFHGSIVIESVDSVVTLSLKEFTHPIIESLRESGKAAEDNVLNSMGHTISFTPKDTVRFTTLKGNSVDFWMEEHDVEPSFFSSDRDKVSYHFRNNETGVEQKSAFDIALVAGYSFNGLMDSTYNHDVDFNGISLVRVFGRPHAKQEERVTKDAATQYLLDIDLRVFLSSDNNISSIIIGDRVYHMRNMHSLDHRISVKYNQDIIIGFGDTKTPTFKFRKDTTSLNGLILEYKMPKYRMLYSVKDKVENNIYVTNSLMQDIKQESSNGVGTNIPDNVALYDIFENSDNIHGFKSFRLLFNTGPTTHNMCIVHEDTNKPYKADEYIEGIKASSGVEWMVKVENLRNTTPFKAEDMLFIVFIVCLASIIVSNLHLLRYKEEYIHRYTFSYAEFTLHIALIFFIAYRCFLLWRTSVFIPIENINYFELRTIFRNGGHLNYLKYGLVMLYTTMAFCKLFLLYYRSKWINCVYDSIYGFVNNSVIKWCNGKLLCWVPVIIYMGSPFLKMSNPRYALIAVVINYFIAEIFIYAKNRFNTYRLFEVNDETGRVGVLSTYLLSVLNMVVAIGLMFLIKDTGFLVMFGTFCLFAIGFKIQDLYVKLAGNNKNDNRLSLFVVIYMVGVFIMLLAYKSIVLWMLHSKISILLLSLVILGAFILICRLAGVELSLPDMRAHFKNKTAKRGIYGAAASLILFVMFGVVATVCFSIKGTSPLESGLLGAHSIQRVNVLEKEPNEILAQAKSNLEESRFLQASYNHWIIEEYYHRSENVKLFGESGNGYFKIHPQSKLGALWNDQLTDIVLLRYVITEHSKILPVIFIFLFLVMLYYGTRMTTYYRFTRSLLVQIPLLLFTQSLLVWMANTQRFVFFGQDFPFISITTKVMLFYFFVLLSIWIAAAIFESVLYRNHDKTEYMQIEKFNKIQSAIALIVLTIILVVSFMMNRPGSRSSGDDGDSDGLSRGYALETLYEKAHPYISTIDSLFRVYQRNNEVVLKSDMHSQIYKFNELYGRTIDSLLTIRDSIAARFPLRAWRNYVNGGSYNNSLNGLIHCHYKNDTLEIALKSDFYDIELPTLNDNEWRGNVIGEISTKDAGADIQQTEYYRYYRLPMGWVKPGTPNCIVKSRGKENVKVFSINENRSIELKKNGVGRAVAFNEYDVVQVDDKKYMQHNGTKDYWARSVLINGRNSFVYPQAEKMYWMRGFANALRNSISKKMNAEGNIKKNAVSQEQDVPVTLNAKLSNDIYSILKESLKEGKAPYSRSVIVVDGNGHIRTMVDYKKGFVVDPNDNEMIQDIYEDLYMNYTDSRVRDESNWFENRNLTHMRGGPGSTQKPLVWNAVASAIDFNWNDLILHKVYEEHLNKKDGEKNLDMYNGKRMLGNKYQRADELNGSLDISLPNFLAHSSNFYSALMVYLGLHNMSTYQKNGWDEPVNMKDESRESVFRYYTTPSTSMDAEK